MTKQNLKSYRMNRREIEQLTNEIESHQMHDSVVSSAEFPYSPHLVAISGGPFHDEKRMEAIRKRTDLLDECRRLEQFVRDIPDPVTRRAFELRYLAGDAEPTWHDIALRIGGNTEESVRKRHIRYLNHKVVRNVRFKRGKI